MRFAMRFLTPAFILFFAFAWLLPFTGAVQAQFLPVKAAEQPAPGAESVAKDSLGRETPQGSFKGFLKAVAAENYEEAAQYLDLSALPRAERQKGADIARNFQTLLDRQALLAPESKISAEPEGHTEDDLDENVDHIGTLRGKNRSLDINLARVANEKGDPVWLFEAGLVREIPVLTRNLVSTPVDRLMTGKLSRLKFQGAPVSHWLVMLGLYLGAYLVSSILVRGLLHAARRLSRLKYNDEAAPPKHRFINAFQMPLSLFAMVWLTALLSILLGVSVIVRQVFAPFSLALGWVAIGLLLWRAVNVVAATLESRMRARDRYNMSSILAFSRRTAKFFFAVLILILILDSFGVNITAALAALGIGGIALALGAQKTLENFIGSLAIIIDQPIHIGDGCKIGDTVGVVEDIGMRSTRIRTNDKTVVTIPNGDLSVQRIENYARRTSFLINRQMILRYDSTSAQIRDFIDRATAILKAHDKIESAANMVRLLGFVDNGYAVQIWCYVRTGNGDEYLQTQADITYSIIDAAKEAGVYFAIPSQTFLPAKDQTGGTGEKTSLQ